MPELIVRPGNGGKMRRTFLAENELLKQAEDAPPDEWFQDTCSLPAGRFDKPAIPQKEDMTK